MLPVTGCAIVPNLYPFPDLCPLYVPLAYFPLKTHVFPHPTEVEFVCRICFGQQNVDGRDRVPDLSLSVR